MDQIGFIYQNLKDKDVFDENETLDEKMELAEIFESHLKISEAGKIINYQNLKNNLSMKPQSDIDKGQDRINIMKDFILKKVNSSKDNERKKALKEMENIVINLSNEIDVDDDFLIHVKYGMKKDKEFANNIIEGLAKT